MGLLGFALLDDEVHGLVDGDLVLASLLVDGGVFVQARRLAGVVLQGGLGPLLLESLEQLALGTFLKSG